MDSPGQQFIEILFGTFGQILSDIFSELISVTFDTFVTPIFEAIAQALVGHHTTP
jgi:hypothetical protein